jgi:hypothetical protein
MGASSSARSAIRAGIATVTVDAIAKAETGTAAAGAADEQQRASGSHFAGGVAGDLEYQHEVLVEGCVS